MANRVYVIAEAGVNHDGDMLEAARLVEAAARAGADCVKFQTFKAGALASAHAPKAEYQLRLTEASETQHTMLSRLELKPEAHFPLKQQAEGLHLDFLSTPFDIGSLSFLTEDLGLQTVKVGSGDSDNAPLLHAIGRSGARVILSTGLSDLGEVEDALAALAYGYAGGTAPRAWGEVEAAWRDPACRALLQGRVTLLQCTTEYPAPANSANLRAMATLSAAFGLPVGFSDHTEGYEIAVAAAALGATVIEKHITMDRSRPGPDHAASLEPEEFEAMVQAIRKVEEALSDGRKTPHPAELKNREIARKSIVARRAIAAGEPLSAENLICKRPGSGLAPKRLWDLYGRFATRAYEPDELLDMAELGGSDR